MNYGPDLYVLHCTTCTTITHDHTFMYCNELQHTIAREMLEDNEPSLLHGIAPIALNGFQVHLT